MIRHGEVEYLFPFRSLAHLWLPCSIGRAVQTAFVVSGALDAEDYKAVHHCASLWLGSVTLCVRPCMLLTSRQKWLHIGSCLNREILVSRYDRNLDAPSMSPVSICVLNLLVCLCRSGDLNHRNSARQVAEID